MTQPGGGRGGGCEFPPPPCAGSPRAPQGHPLASSPRFGDGCCPPPSLGPPRHQPHGAGGEDEPRWLPWGGGGTTPTLSPWCHPPPVPKSPCLEPYTATSPVLLRGHAQLITSLPPHRQLAADANEPGGGGVSRRGMPVCRMCWGTGSTLGTPGTGRTMGTGRASGMGAHRGKGAGGALARPGAHRGGGDTVPGPPCGQRVTLSPLAPHNEVTSAAPAAPGTC